MTPDPHDGISIVLELTRPAVDADVHAARELRDAWLARYDGGARYRNCGIEGDEIGASVVVLWADGIDDPDGSEAAIAHAEAIARSAVSTLPIRTFRLSDSREASEQDLHDRLGVAPVAVHAGGDVVGDLRKAGPLSGTPAPGRARRSRLAWLPLTVLALTCTCGWLGLRELTAPPEVVRDLPSEAADVHHLSQDLFPDWAFYLTARLADAACRRHVEEHFADLAPLDLHAIEEHERHWVHWGTPFDEQDQPVDWWAPAPMTRENTWVHHVGDVWELVQCEGGRIHVYFFSH